VLTQDDHRRIEAAVAEAEAGSSGDILVVLAGEVSSYRETPIAWGAAVALVVPPILLAASLGRLVTAVSGGGWTAAQAGALQPQIGAILTGYVVSQLVLFAATVLLVSAPPVRRALTPRFLKRHRVKKAAFHHFAAAHAHAKDSDTGVLVFVALVDRQVQILADRAIHEKAGDAVWKAAAAAIQTGMRRPDPTSGILEAIGLCGAALKAHFPSSRRRRADRPTEV